MVRKGRSVCCAGQDWHGWLLLAAVVVEVVAMFLALTSPLFKEEGSARLLVFEVGAGASVLGSQLGGSEESAMLVLLAVVVEFVAIFSALTSPLSKEEGSARSLVVGAGVRFSVLRSQLAGSEKSARVSVLSKML